jgi:hypothetical protein
MGAIVCADGGGAMSEWRSIQTAPHMKNLLLWAATDVADTGEIKNWKMDTGYWSEGAQCWTWSGYQVRKYDIQPTHWMPLPEPPK